MSEEPRCSDLGFLDTRLDRRVRDVVNVGLGGCSEMVLVELAFLLRRLTIFRGQQRLTTYPTTSRPTKAAAPYPMMVNQDVAEAAWNCSSAIRSWDLKVARSMGSSEVDFRNSSTICSWTLILTSTSC